jgi:hypothetical protein
MSSHDDRTQVEEKEEPDYFMYFSVFLLAFWPVTLVLGVADYFFLLSYDMGLFDLPMGLLVGWITPSVYRAKERKKLVS